MATSCNFTMDIPPGTILDPHKRVRHFTGLVMGVEEFRQDQLYFMARDELHQRALHGYGRVSGLGVSIRINAETGHPEVVVAAGMAVNPRGETICVPRAQCGDLNEWLENHRDGLLGSPPSLLPGAVSLYLVLCARDCQTDAVPVLGDPCRTLEDATAASRIADDFEICLRLEPPQQLEEAAVRQLGELLRAIEISDTGEHLSPAQLADLVRELIPAGSPPGLGEIAPGDGSPPPSLRLHPDDAAEALAEAHRVWIQEVRPALNPATGVCEIPRDDDDGRCVLLACLEVGYDEGVGGLVASGEPTVDSSCGPILVQSRVLQELLLGGPYRALAAAPGETDSPPTQTPMPISHADLLDLQADDHRQYLLVDPGSRALVAELSAAGNLITGLGEPGAPGGDEAVRWDRAVKREDSAGGDLAGQYPDPQVRALRGNPVATESLGATHSGRVLRWDGATWRSGELPSQPPSTEAPAPLESDLVRIVNLSWRHGGGTLLEITHDGNPVRALAVGLGTRPGEPAPVQARTLSNNTFRVFLRIESSREQGIAIFRVVELRPGAVLPVNVVGLDNDLIVETRTPGDADEVNGILFRIDEETVSALLERRLQLFIQLAGDHILDREGQAIDGEFPRGTLPSGDGPGGAELGIQGGRFDSWVTSGRVEIILDDLDINIVSASELTRLPGIGAVLANRIVELRERRNGFSSLEDMADAVGLRGSVLDRLRELLRG